MEEIRVCNCFDRDSLMQLLNVPNAIRDVTLVAKEFVFEFSSPSKLLKVRGFFDVKKSDDDLEELRTPPKLVKSNKFEDLQTPGAPQKSPRSRMIPGGRISMFSLSPEQRKEGC